MSNRFRPNIQERPTGRGRVPVTRPVGRQQVNQPPQQPTHSYEDEQPRRRYPEEQYNEPQYNEPQYDEPQYDEPQYEEPQQNNSRLAIPPNFGGFEDEFEEEERTRGKSNLLKYILFGFMGIAVLGLIVFVGMKFLGDKGTPLMDPAPIVQGEDTDRIGDGTKTPKADNKSGDTAFDGNPTPIKWPADVQPTRMELQLDPISGDPVLLLVGDKSGLGTVIRSYSHSGKLTGHWVIVPDGSEGNTDTSNNGDSSVIIETEDDEEE